MYGSYDAAFGFIGGYRRTWTKDDIRILIWCCTDIVPGPEKTPCWVWRLRTSQGGYAYMHINREPLMHRNSHIVFKGQIPEGRVIMHLCNNKMCINPKHLQVGDHIENVRAAYSAGLHLIYKGPPVHIYRRL
jgi:hypothetical protein